ncbi:MAG: transglutaminase domain-containing protein, partial [Bacteroidota bacterium]
FLSNNTFGQSPDLLFQDLKQRYPNAKAVYLLKKKTNRLVQEGQRWFIYEDYHTEIMHLRRGSVDWIDDQIVYSQFSEIIDYQAYTIFTNREGNNEQLSHVHFLDYDLRDEDVFYDDTRIREFVFPRVSPKSITVLRYTRKLKDAHFWSGFFLTANIPVERVEVRVEYPHNAQVIPTPYSLPKTVTFNQSQGVFAWQGDRLPAYSPSPLNSPSLREKVPHLLFRLAAYKDSTGWKPFLEDTESLYLWYYPFIRGIDQASYQDLELLVQEIVEADDSTEQKARKIFAWVQKHIRYLAFEEGWSGFIPEKPYEVCQKGYGDCKSMSSVLVGMLRSVGINAYFAWTGSRQLPYTYDELPTPLVDNHMMVMAIIEEDTLWLDATSDFRQFGVAAQFTQGKEALVAVSPEKGIIRKISKQPAEFNQVIDSCQLHLDKNDLIAKGKIQFFGYAKTRTSETIQAYSSSQLNQLIPKILNYTHANLEIESIAYKNLDSSDLPLELSYEIRLRDYAHEFRNTVYFNPHLAPMWQESYIPKNRIEAWVNDYAFDYKRVHTFVLPEGYRLYQNLDSTSFMRKRMGYSLDYKVNEGSMTVYQHVFSDKLRMLPNEFEDWNEIVRRVTNIYQENIRLIR